MTSRQRRIVVRVLIVFALAWLITIAWLSFRYPSPASQPTTAVITHFRPGIGRIQANLVDVTAQTASGISGTDVVSSEKLMDRKCRVGDQVTGEIIGIELKFDALTCAPAKAGAQTAAAGSAVDAGK